MKLAEALDIINYAKQRQGETFTCFLATAFNPLHLETFLVAELSLLFTNRKIEIQCGLYGDLVGNVSRLSKSVADCGVVLIEWADLDARLGIRSSAPCSPSLYDDIVATVRTRSSRILEFVKHTSSKMPVVICFPSLPLPPISHFPSWQASSLEIDLNAIMYSFRSQISRCSQVQILSSERLDILSPLAQRFDVESELRAGFPYGLTHASRMAKLLAQLTRRPTPKKGLITDLDDTLWKGIVGEIGIQEISWDLEHHSQMHAFYQRILGSLASEGVLLAIASKNEPALVESALTRKDLALSPSAFFPLEVGWRAKSEAVGRILKTWNVGSDSVVFIDDSPLELAEVKAAYPEVECIQFPTKNATAIYDLALHLRDLFGRSILLEEDSIRAESIRRSHAAVGGHTETQTPTDFLERAEAEISLNFSKTPLDPRALDLVNKTNQFNLNGKRYTETSWQSYLRDPASFLLVASYTDKYGPLGKIAVIAGRYNKEKLRIDTWVMSCRAFSRRIEHRCLDELFSKFQIDKIELAFAETERNGPLREFLGEMLDEAPTPDCKISRQLFEVRSKNLPEPQEITNG